MRENRRTLKGKLKDLTSKVKRISLGKESNLDIDKILNPPTWRERQIQNKAIDREYEENIVALEKTASWADKYDKDFKRMKQEVVRVREVDE